MNAANQKRGRAEPDYGRAMTLDECLINDFIADLIGTGYLIYANYDDEGSERFVGFTAYDSEGNRMVGVRFKAEPEAT